MAGREDLGGGYDGELGVDVLVSGADAGALAPGVSVGGGATKIESHP